MRDQASVNLIGEPDLAEKSARPDSDALAVWCFCILLGYTIVRNLLAALTKPFWFDEILTVLISRRPDLHSVWQSVGAAKDANPPGFYTVEHLLHVFAANPHIAYRLPSILAFCCMLACVFIYVRRRSGGNIALICTGTLLLTPFLRPYAVEARPYSLVAACLALALVCYQRAPRVSWMVLMGAAFAAAESFHYYALFGFVPFGIAEFAAAIRLRRVRWAVWLAMAAGLLPLVAFWPLLKGIQHYYGAHVWDPPSLFATANVYSLLFKTNAPIALALVAALAVLVLWNPNASSSIESATDRIADTSHRWLVVAFFSLPIVAFVVTSVMHGAYLERYVLPTLFALPLSLVYVLRRLGRQGVALVALFVFSGVGAQEVFFWQSAWHDLRNPSSPSAPIEGLVNRVGYSDLPVVVSDGQDYLLINYYSGDSRRYVAVVDPPQAVAYVRTDTVDLQLPALRCCMEVQVYTFPEFAAQHSSFLLYSGGGEWDWWAARLANDGDSLQLLAEEQNRRVYLVQLKTKASR